MGKKLARVAAALVGFALAACVPWEGDEAPTPTPTSTPTPRPTAVSMQERFLSDPGHAGLPKDSDGRGVYQWDDQDLSDNYHTHYCVAAPGTLLLIPHIHNSDEKFPKKGQLGDFGGDLGEREVECLDHAYPDWRDEGDY